MNNLTPQEMELSSLIIKTLNLSTEPHNIDPESPLYGGELGLDSIDILEISMVVSKKYGVTIANDSENKVEIFSCLRNLSTYIESHQVI